MNYNVLSLKYRPTDFGELTGQDHVKLSLQGAIRSGRIGHAFLFAGPRGVGKTTAARIFARSLNCIQGPTVNPCKICASCKEIGSSRSLDVVEIDGASNRGIDEIRNLREAAQYAPLHSRNKIYIIDEVHMLTNEAFNALLKTLEEPPPNVIFIFATTNPNKVPQTILSRCERFMFKRLSVKEISGRLKDICQKESIGITDKALHYVAMRADGSVRDGESILEQLASFIEGAIQEEHVLKLVGFLGSDFYLDLLQMIMQQSHGDVLRALNKGIDEGADPVEIYRGLVDHLRSALLASTDLPNDFIELGEDDIQRVRKMELPRDRVIDMLETLLKAEDLIRRSMNARIAVELLLLQLMKSIDPPSAVRNDGGPADIKKEIVNALEESSPKLAALVRSAVVSVEGADVHINAKDDFARNMLSASQSALEEILRRSLKKNITVRFDLAARKVDNNFEDKIKTQFNAEEVR